MQTFGAFNGFARRSFGRFLRAELLSKLGRDEEALALIGEAREMAELKGSPVMVDRLDELAAQAAPTRPV